MYAVWTERDAETSFWYFRRCDTPECLRIASLMPVVLAQHRSWSDFLQIVANKPYLGRRSSVGLYVGSISHIAK